MSVAAATGPCHLRDGELRPISFEEVCSTARRRRSSATREPQGSSCKCPLPVDGQCLERDSVPLWTDSAGQPGHRLPAPFREGHQDIGDGQGWPRRRREVHRAAEAGGSWGADLDPGGLAFCFLQLASPQPAIAAPAWPQHHASGRASQSRHGTRRTQPSLNGCQAQQRIRRRETRRTVTTSRRSGSRPARALVALAAVIVIMLISVLGNQALSPGKMASAVQGRARPRPVRRHRGDAEGGDP